MYCFRIISNYVDKIIENNFYLDGMPMLHQRMVNYSKHSPSDVEKMFYASQGFHVNKSFSALKLRTISCSRVKFYEPFNDNNSPTFRGFVLGIIFERVFKCNFTTEKDVKDCISQENPHHRTYMSNCAHCDIRYDGVIKVRPKLPKIV